MGKEHTGKAERAAKVVTNELAQRLAHIQVDPFTPFHVLFNPNYYEPKTHSRNQVVRDIYSTRGIKPVWFAEWHDTIDGYLDENKRSHERSKINRQFIQVYEALQEILSETIPTHTTTASARRLPIAEAEYRQNVQILFDEVRKHPSEKGAGGLSLPEISIGDAKLMILAFPKQIEEYISSHKIAPSLYFVATALGIEIPEEK